MSLIQSRVAWRLFRYEDFPKNPVEIKSDPKTWQKNDVELWENTIVINYIWKYTQLNLIFNYKM